MKIKSDLSGKNYEVDKDEIKNFIKNSAGVKKALSSFKDGLFIGSTDTLMGISYKYQIIFDEAFYLIVKVLDKSEKINESLLDIIDKAKVEVSLKDMVIILEEYIEDKCYIFYNKKITKYKEELIKTIRDNFLKDGYFLIDNVNAFYNDYYLFSNNQIHNYIEGININLESIKNLDIDKEKIKLNKDEVNAKDIGEHLKSIDDDVIFSLNFLSFNKDKTYIEEDKNDKDIFNKKDFNNFKDNLKAMKNDVYLIPVDTNMPSFKISKKDTLKSNVFSGSLHKEDNLYNKDILKDINKKIKDLDVYCKNYKNEVMTILKEYEFNLVGANDENDAINKMALLDGLF